MSVRIRLVAKTTHDIYTFISDILHTKPSSFKPSRACFLIARLTDSLIILNTYKFYIENIKTVKQIFVDNTKI